MDAFILYTIKSSLCLSAGYFLYRLLLRHETFHRFKRFVILAILFISMAVPLVKLQVDATAASVPAQKQGPVFFTAENAIFAGQDNHKTAVQPETGSSINILALVYLAGASIQVFLVLFSMARTILIIRRSKKINFHGVPLALTTSSMAPCCFGRLIIISEKDFREHGKEVVLHETSHMKQFHGLDLFISEMCLVVTWYNPVTWLIRHELRQNHEFEADSHVLSQGIDASDYQLLLVRTVAGESRFNLANQFNQSSIKNRISMMNRGKSNRLAILKGLLFIPLIALMVQVFAQKVVRQAYAPPRAVTHGKYLELTADQLNSLGFDWNQNGLFYKNRRVNRPDKNILCMYFTDSMYSASIILGPGEKLNNTLPQRILKNQATTSFDFYPVVVAGVNGLYTLVMGNPGKNPGEKLLPVQVNMADLKVRKRSDTLVFWFRPTATMMEILSPVVKAEDFLQPCPPDIRETRKAPNSHI
ncbi:MAG: hypothetical protein NT040_03460 [Bacteroidetes bacterium]|nr:hypothetical protein [Bacteroidota bacterium]